MSFLLHCNHCFALPESQPQFYYTSCGHILCKMCVQNMSSDSCPVCGVARIQKLDLMTNSPQAKELRTYFSDPFTVLEHVMTKAKFLQKFQNTQLQSIIRLIKVPYHEVDELNREKELIDDKIKAAYEEQIGLQNEHDDALSALQKSCKKSGNASKSRANGFRSLAHDNVLDMLTCKDIAGNQLLSGTTTVQDHVQPMPNTPVAFQSHQITKRGYSSDTTDSLNDRFRPVERAATTPPGSQNRRSRRDQEGDTSAVTARGPVHYAEGRLSINRIKSPSSGSPSNRSPATVFCSPSKILRRQQTGNRISPLSRTPSPASSITSTRSSPSNNQNPQIRSNVIVNESTGFRLLQNNNSSARASREYTVPYGNSAASLRTIRSEWSPQPSAFVGTSTNLESNVGRSGGGMRLNFNRPQQHNQNPPQKNRRVSSDSINWPGNGHGRFGQSPLPMSKFTSKYF